MEFFKKDNDINDDLKRDVAFQAVVGMRDAVSLATRKGQPPSYEQSLRLYNDLDPEIYNDFDQLLAEKNDNDIVKLYREEAKLQTSVAGRQIDPADLINNEIDRLKKLKSKASVSSDDVKYINRKIAQLYGGLENLKPRHLTENAILTRDFAQVDRSQVFGEKILSDYKHVDYALTRDRFLRLRLLHPDKEEHITGADLIYEQYDLTTNQIRFVFLQYKTWEDGVLYFSQHKNLQPQLEKLKQTLCDCNFCTAPTNSTELIDYRMPYCSGFLRPTDKLQHKGSKMVSSGLHIPACNALKLAIETTKIEKKGLRNKTPNHYIFEKLFNLNLVGSRWLDIDQTEEFYKSKKILDPDDTIKLYAREFIKSKVKDDEESDEF